MSEPIISVRNLGKRYRLGLTHEDLLINRCINGVKNLFRRRGDGKAKKDFWALKDVSFDVEQGEIVGVIGKNGAGKSTLLKILSRITNPTTGEVRLNGRVGSLLEVGTGFHPELTGRENIFLNGAILGMTRPEIKAKFDEIVDFSGVEKFIDTPVKRYSSGMYVRLAFAIAAHLEPEILFVDEVLAVGDAAFQKKCLGKMSEVAKEGRTVLFVSHNMASIVELCPNCLWLDRGRTVERGKAREVVMNYLTFGRPVRADGVIARGMHAHDPLEICFTRILILGENGEPTSVALFGEPLHIRCEFDVTQALPAARLGIAIFKLDGTLVCALHHTDDVTQDILALRPGKYIVDAIVEVPLMPGGYSVDLFAKPDPGFWESGERSMDWVQGAMVFHVEKASNDGAPVLHTSGILLPSSQWSLSAANYRSTQSEGTIN